MQSLGFFLSCAAHTVPVSVSLEEGFLCFKSQGSRGILYFRGFHTGGGLPSPPRTPASCATRTPAFWIAQWCARPAGGPLGRVQERQTPSQCWLRSFFWWGEKNNQNSLSGQKGPKPADKAAEYIFSSHLLPLEGTPWSNATSPGVGYRLQMAGVASAAPARYLEGIGTPGQWQRPR